MSMFSQVAALSLSLSLSLSISPKSSLNETALVLGVAGVRPEAPVAIWEVAISEVAIWEVRPSVCLGRSE